MTGPRPGSAREGAVELWRQDDGAWRWRWVSPDGRTTLVSHRAYDERAEAVESAQEAYPDAAVPPAEETATPRRRRVRRLAGAVVVLAGVMVGAVVLGRTRRTLATSHAGRRE